jgi:hypothetical protein
VKLKEAITTDDAGQGGSARYWNTPRKGMTALKKFQDKENINRFKLSPCSDCCMLSSW